MSRIFNLVHVADRSFRSDQSDERISSNATDSSPSDALINAIVKKDQELKRLIEEKDHLLSRLINVSSNLSISSRQANSSLEAITYATSYRKYLCRDEMSTWIDSIFV